MQRGVSALVTVALVLCAVAAPVAAGLTPPEMATGVEQQTTDGDIADENESSPGGNASPLGPGELLVGVVGVQEAEIEGEIENRTFGIRVARAATADAKAAVVKSQLDSIEGRLTALRERKRVLDQARENGTISEGRYRAEIAAVATRTETVKRLANSTEDEAEGLPVELLESKGINVTAIQMLKQNASNLTGPEVAQIARSIAGPPANVPDIGPPREHGPGGGDENVTNQTGPPPFVGDTSPADTSNRTRENASDQPPDSGQNGSSNPEGGNGAPAGSGPNDGAGPSGQNPGNSGQARGQGA